MSYKRDIRDGAAGLSLFALAAVATVVLAVVIGAVGIFGFGWLSNSTANFRGEVAKRNLVEANGSYRIAAYDHFFDLCQQVQTKEASIANVQDELKTTKDPQRALVLNASITALRNSRADLITQYNADSDKSYTEGQFKSSNLPYELYPTTQETVCHA